MVHSSQRVMEDVISLDAIRSYVRELLAKYTARLVQYRPVRHARAVRFRCESTRLAASMQPSCHAPGSAHRFHLQGTRCGFTNPDAERVDRLYNTLHDAAEELFAGSRERRAPPAERAARSAARLLPAAGALTAVRDIVCSVTGRADARTARPRALWCYDFETEAECLSHKVPGTGTQGCSRRQERACVWRPGLQRLELDVASLCPRGGGRSPSISSCVALSGCEELCGRAWVVRNNASSCGR